MTGESHADCNNYVDFACNLSMYAVGRIQQEKNGIFYDDFIGSNFVNVGRDYYNGCDTGDVYGYIRYPNKEVEK